MKKSLILLAIILVLLTGCKDKNGSTTSAPTVAPTATATPTQKPTKAPTCTPTDIDWPPEPSLSEETMMHLKSFINSDAIGDLIVQIAASKASAEFLYDTYSSLPWGTITDVDNHTGNKIAVCISNGYNYVQNLLKDGMTVDELGKLVKSGRTSLTILIPKVKNPMVQFFLFSAISTLHVPFCLS